jgi:hypothetical protein
MKPDNEKLAGYAQELKSGFPGEIRPRMSRVLEMNQEQCRAARRRMPVFGPSDLQKPALGAPAPESPGRKPQGRAFQ